MVSDIDSLIVMLILLVKMREIASEIAVNLGSKYKLSLHLSVNSVN